MTPETVASFWETAGPSCWFAKDAVFDGALAVRFGEALAQARAGTFDHWGETPEGALGLVILLDQVSRNIHRGSPLAFAADAKALALARAWIGRGYHQKLVAPRAKWLLMPLEHAEDLDAQQRCVALFRSMGLSEMAHWAQIHLDIIARFGRFPHRNRDLVRENTDTEEAYLKDASHFGP